ncbi:Aste57867_1344 [Aphanomyces stellatus]|uniref:RNA methyltransferase n=1 Tax=Aphanomyces stellatus TaxID=120398 RepID=A0A485K7N0_9STRA|nr:hypothetical protein As57867_001343 [Aphanomyces stellatus]VFT78563.1 Aste57867_1344 [Aphanomyces stellatus]
MSAPPPPPPTDHLAIEHVFGNFHDYYDFNPESERLRFLTPDIRRALRQYFLAQPGQKGSLLDVGCNEGKLTMGLFDALTTSRSTQLDEHAVFSTDSITRLNDALQQQHVPFEYVTIGDSGTAHRPQFTIHVYIYGVFFGEGHGVSKKVARAKAASEALGHWHNMHVGAIETEAAASSRDNGMTIDDDDVGAIDLHVLGIDIDDVLIARATQRWATHPSVSFAMGDIMQPNDALFAPYLLGTDRRFDLVTVFSVTMWIHLNHGDAGLSAFLDAVSQRAAHVIIEPQPWKCYRTAIGRLKRKAIRNPFQPLKHTHEDATAFIHTKLAAWFPHKTLLGKTNWSRQVWLYSRTPLPGVRYDTT